MMTVVASLQLRSPFTVGCFTQLILFQWFPTNTFRFFLTTVSDLPWFSCLHYPFCRLNTKCPFNQPGYRHHYWHPGHESSPVPHSNFSAALLRKSYQAQDMPYLLSSVPSLVESSDGGTSVGYTGLRIRGSDPTRINVTINRVYHSTTPKARSCTGWILPDLAASAAKVQVQRGVGISTNGAGSFGATVNVDLSQVRPDPFATITNTFGSFDTRKHSAQFGTELIRQHWAFTGRVSSVHSDGFIDRAATDLHSYHLSGAYIDARQTLQFHVLSGHEITYQAWNGVPAQYIDIDSLRTYNSAGAEKAGSPYDNEIDDYTQQHYLLHYKRLFDKGLSLQLNGHYTRGYGYYEQYKAAQLFANYGVPDLSLGDSTLSTTDLIRQRWLDNHFYGAVFLLRWAPSINPPFLRGNGQFHWGGAISRYQGTALR